ncbi:MAG TPA: hypothetical protein DIW37_11765 [Chryseobacterium sp.]|uniref:Uncharacterized protein n=1 Tax=Chryseobacterium mucoviscidosis TaxID=1945581 RepID=A0A202BVZ7_9FLAO|nr:hypothetical protein B0E34_14865 [Chryseobacterium mucoviscidosis]HCR77056.1 hypothetical protein [Chryseobacterium sp.]
MVKKFKVYLQAKHIHLILYYYSQFFLYLNFNHHKLKILNRQYLSWSLLNLNKTVKLFTNNVVKLKIGLQKTF